MILLDRVKDGEKCIKSESSKLKLTREYSPKQKLNYQLNP